MSLSHSASRFQNRPCAPRVRFTAVSLALLTLLLLTGCGTTNKEQGESNSVIREESGGQEAHGEVGAMYGRSSR